MNTYFVLTEKDGLQVGGGRRSREFAERLADDYILVSQEEAVVIEWDTELAWPVEEEAS